MTHCNNTKEHIIYSSVILNHTAVHTTLGYAIKNLIFFIIINIY